MTLLLTSFAGVDSIVVEIDLPNGVPAGTFTAGLFGPLPTANRNALAAWSGTPTAVTPTDRAAAPPFPVGKTCTFPAPGSPRAPGYYGIDLKVSNGGVVSSVVEPAFVYVRRGI